MDEDISIKVAAPITRMRRRLSEQSDNAKSPSTPSTPTKKKGGRLLSQLNQINENDPVNSLRKNTKAQILTETTQSVHSPRAQRAARRNSRVDSDTETSVTSVRQTRRTRKDSTSSTENLKVTPARVTRKTTRTSTSSTDNQVEDVSLKKLIIQEAICEEQESNLQQNNLEKLDISKSEDNSPNNIRKSPRLKAKKDKNYTISPEIKDKKLESKTAVIVPKLNLKETTKSTLLINSSPKNSSTDTSDKTEISQDINDKFTEASFNLINQLDVVSKNKNTNLNKSASALQNSKNTSKRHRTKSWTENCTIVSNNDNNFHSDTEISKNINKSREQSNMKKPITKDSLREVVNNHTMQENKDNMDTISLNTNLTPECREGSIKNNKNDNNEDHEPNRTIKLLEKSPSKNVKSMVYFEDTDSNTAVDHHYINKINHNEDQCVPIAKYQFEKQNQSAAQPDANNSKQNEGNNSFANSVSLNFYNTGKNDSCEPMDVDVTIPENVDITYPSKEDKFASQFNITVEVTNDEQPKLSRINAKESSQESDNSHKSNKSSIDCVSFDTDKINRENVETGSNNQQMSNSSMNLEKSLKSNKSKRKSLQYSLSQEMNKSGNDNKNTLVLPQIKNISTNDYIPNSENPTKDIIEKSTGNPNISKNNENNTINVSNDDLADTPLKQKNILKLGMQTSTPVINGKSNNRKETVKTKTPKKAISTISKTSESELESDEGSKEQNNLIDDKAEHVGDDYESGDSQDEDDIENDKYNKILESGETLTSEDEISNDSDYEKDSFLVSSDGEDNELLSGTGDDLSMSDKELTMSAKSKQKYNKRKTKEQKKASREMYESRHKLMVSSKSKKKRSSSSEDEHPTLKMKKKNRLRLESYTTDLDESVHTIKKVKKLSKSIEDNDAMNQNDLTIASGNVSKDIITKPENKSRLRLDSITDLSTTKSDVDESISKKKTKKRISESYNESAVYEKEITAVCNESVINKKDPLSLLVKIERPTPQKDNTVNITYREEIQEIQVESNTTVMTHNESVDPLQTTVAIDDNSVSENEIKQNYDSVLRDLNKESKRIKSHDISLKLKNKNNLKDKNPIIDQLNLTHTKQSKKKIRKGLHEEVNENTPKNAENESSCDAIDLKLIFPQDSDDSEEEQTKECNEKIEVFIPLKRTEGKTSITDMNEHNNDVSLNEGTKKNNKKRKSSLKSSDTGKENDQDEKKFFIHTKSRTDSETSTVFTNTSVTNKNMFIDESSDAFKEIGKNEHDDQTLNESMKKKNKKRKSSLKSSDTGKDGDEGVTVPFVDTKGRRSESETSHVLVDTTQTNKNISIDENPDAIEEKDNNEHNSDRSLNEIMKKKEKKRKTSLKSSNTADKENDEDVTVPSIITKGGRSESETSTNVLVNTSTTNKNMSVDENPVAIKIIDNNEHDNDRTLNESMKKKKKNKKRKSSLKSSDTGKENDEDVTVPFVNTKDRKSDAETSRVLVNTSTTDMSIELNPDAIEEIDVRKDEKAETVKSRKRKRLSSVVAVSDEIVEEIDDQNTEVSLFKNSNTKKRKTSHREENMDIQNEEIDDQNTEESKKNQKKKRKTSHREDNIDIQNKDVIVNEQDVINKPEQDNFGKKKKKENINKEHAQEQSSVSKKKQGNSTENIETVQDVKIMTKQEDKRKAEHVSIDKKKKKNKNENQENVAAAKQMSDTIPPKKNQHGIQNKQKNPEISKKKKHSTDEDNAQKLTGHAGNDNKTTQKINKKRKERDDDANEVKNTKIFKKNSLDSIHVPRLPADILKQLDCKRTSKSAAISTTKFVVEETKRRKNKPSNYLEETINLNADSPMIKKNKSRSKKPNVLPFIPTASISDNGCTTNFKINIIPQEAKFISQATDASNFKQNYLYSNKIKRLGTYELYKKHRTIKLSKF